MNKNHISMTLTIAVIAILPLACSDSESPTGTGSSVYTLAAGVWDFTTTRWTCGDVDTLSFGGTITACSAMSAGDFLDLDCPVTQKGNALSIDCTSVRDDNGCTYTERIVGTGTVSGDTWIIRITVTATNQNPPQCYADSCFLSTISVTRSAAKPSACVYAPANSFLLNIGSGPLQGTRTFRGGAFVSAVTPQGTSGGVRYAYSGAAEYSAAGVHGSIFFSTTYMDPQTLPDTLSVVVGRPQSSSAGNSGYDLLMDYSDGTDGGQEYVPESAVGLFIVEQLSQELIAGTVDMTLISGFEGREISGGFFFQGQSEPPASAPMFEPRSPMSWLRNPR